MSSRRRSSRVSSSRLRPVRSAAVTRSSSRSRTAPARRVVERLLPGVPRRARRGSSTRAALVGGKPVPGVGWVFVRAVARARCPRAAMATKEARTAKRAPGQAEAPAKRASEEVGGEATRPGSTPRSDDSRGEATRPSKPRRAKRPSAASARRRVVETPIRRPRSAEPINDPRGNSSRSSRPTNSERSVEATVIEFSSHGAYVDVDGARCYVPLKSMGDPAPRSAREVLDMGETRTSSCRASTRLGGASISCSRAPGPWVRRKPSHRPQSRLEATPTTVVRTPDNRSNRSSPPRRQLWQ